MSLEEILRDLPDRLDGHDVLIEAKTVENESDETTSAMVRVVLVDRGARTLTLIDATEHLRSVVVDAAGEAGLLDRVRLA